ncbi:MAG: DNA ligase D [Enhygromyxa sp.]
MAGLEAYRQKRDFSSTPEPPGEPRESGERRFVIQEHAARRLHYDLRLEHEGVLWSWAVPRGPSLDPRQRRLAVQTEDHPIDYADFEGVIPPGQYGAGRVLVWDRGNWIPEGDPHKDHERGRLRFLLQGEKLHGRWNLIRTKDAKTWLLIKSRDEFARPDSEAEIVEEQPRSVLSGRRIDEIDDRPVDPAGLELELPERAERAEPDEPPRLSPQLASLARRAPEGPSWLHELKLDGYRILAEIGDGEVRLRTRGGEDWSARLPELARALDHPALADSVLDGELCAIDPSGASSFDRLQKALAEGRTADLMFWVFDLPFARGHDLRRVPLLERKQTLAWLLERLGDDRRVRYCDHVIGGGPEVFARACALGAEGVISKRIDSSYESRRARTWLKLKCPRRMRVVVGGYTPPQGSRRHFGALLVGTFDEQGQLRYRGKVGSGFSEEQLASLLPRLEALRQPRPPFVDPPTGGEARGVLWTTPQLRVEVDYGDLTEQGRLRFGRFVGLGDEQPDPPPSSASALSFSRGTVRLTHPGKLLYPARSLSKRDVADYLMKVAEWMLPHVRDRPLTLVRCPEGVEAGCFYQKHAMAGLPESVRRVPIRDSDGAEAVYAAVSDALGLVGLIQMSVIEIHLWGSRVDDLERPDRLVFDLDPDLGLDFARVVHAALELRDRLAELGLRSFVKTTGGKGLHVVAPIEPRLEFGPAKQFCRAFAARLVADAPERYTAVLSKAERRKKIFIDYLRNGRGATSIAPYSPRARPEATVSTPLAWDELDAKLRPERFDLLTVPQRLAQLERDPWAELPELRQSISESALRALGLDSLE